MRYPDRIDGAERYRRVRRVLIIEMALNLLVAGGKGTFGLATGALALAADAVHSLVDATANVVALVLLGAAAQPPDADHPYGHRKLEVIAAAAIGVAIGAAALRFGWSAIEALIQGQQPPATSPLGFGVIIGALVVNIFVATYEARKARELDSEFLAADAAHTASDVAVTTAVLGSYAAAHAGVWWADPIGALAVILVIGRIAYQILAKNLGVLIDQAVLDAERVSEIAHGIAGVRGVHRVRSRGPRTAVLVDLHLLLDGEMSLRAAHDIAHQVEDILRAQWPAIADVTVHMEPEDDGEEGL